METIIIKDFESDEFRQAVMSIRNGQLVAFPTETVYGLGANALDPEAVRKIFDAKGRPSDNPLIVHIASKDQLLPLVKSITPLARKLIESFMPGPITFVFDKSKLIPYEVTAGLNTVAIRIPSHPIAHKFLEMADIPVAAPSANMSGTPSATTAAHVYDDLNNRIPFIIDGGHCLVGVESTVVDVTGDIPVILRPGVITAEQIRGIAGDVSGIGSDSFGDGSYETAINQNTPDVPASPGMKYRHYAPKAEIWLADAPQQDERIRITKEMVQKAIADGMNVGVYGNERLVAAINADSFGGTLYTFSYGSEGDIRKASAKLFYALREMDTRRLDVVIAETFPIKGIGVAYMNRLLKAAGISTKKSIKGKKDKILFVCTGNTCRSPIAEYYFNTVAIRNKSGFYAESAGMDTIDSLPATNEAMETMDELYGIDLSGHLSKKVTEKQIADANTILTMTNYQKMMLKETFPWHSNKIYTLSEFAAKLAKNKENVELYDIPDPFGNRKRSYQETAKCIAKYIDIIFKYL